MKRVATSQAPAALGPYAQGAISGNLIFTAGQIALTPAGELFEGTIEDETHQVMANLGAILEAAGVGFENVVKTTIYLTDTSLFKQVNGIYGSYFPEGSYPARECVGIATLPVPGARVEISMIAERADATKS